MKKLIASGVILMSLFSFFGCGGDPAVLPEWAKPGDMIFDYYERTVGTPEEQPYYEVVLYAYSDNEVRMEVYTDGGSPDEVMTESTVPIQVYLDAMDAVRETGMDRWIGRNDLSGITGHLFVCKFPGEHGMVRVSSEAMPEDGKDAFYKVLGVLNAGK